MKKANYTLDFVGIGLAAVAVITLLLALFGPMVVHAQTKNIKVATGSAGNTYSTVFRELAAACKDSMQLTEANTSGSIQNLDMLIGNQVNGAMMQIDVLFSQAQTQNLGAYKTLVNLFPEEVHVVAPAVSRVKAGGYGVGGLKIGEKPIEFTNIGDFAGYRIGAAGGSVRTATLIKLLSQINFQVVELPDNKAVQQALDGGNIEAALFVGGQPLGSVKALGAQYKLIAFPEAVQGMLKNVYKPAVLNYNGMGRGGVGVRTIATEAALVVQTYKTPAMVSALSQFRACAMAKADELKEELGTHPAWKHIASDQSENPDSRGKWAWMDLPGAAAPAPAPVQQPAPAPAGKPAKRP